MFQDLGVLDVSRRALMVEDLVPDLYERCMLSTLQALPVQYREKAAEIAQNEPDLFHSYCEWFIKDYDIFLTKVIHEFMEDFSEAFKSDI